MFFWQSFIYKKIREYMVVLLKIVEEPETSCLFVLYSDAASCCCF